MRFNSSLLLLLYVVPVLTISNATSRYLNIHRERLDFLTDLFHQHYDKYPNLPYVGNELVYKDGEVAEGGGDGVAIQWTLWLTQLSHVDEKHGIASILGCHLIVSIWRKTSLILSRFVYDSIRKPHPILPIIFHQNVIKETSLNLEGEIYIFEDYINIGVAFGWIGFVVCDFQLFYYPFVDQLCYMNQTIIFGLPIGIKPACTMYHFKNADLIWSMKGCMATLLNDTSPHEFVVRYCMLLLVVHYTFLIGQSPTPVLLGTILPAVFVSILVGPIMLLLRKEESVVVGITLLITYFILLGATASALPPSAYMPIFHYYMLALILTLATQILFVSFYQIPQKKALKIYGAGLLLQVLAMTVMLITYSQAPQTTCEIFNKQRGFQRCRFMDKMVEAYQLWF